MGPSPSAQTKTLRHIYQTWRARLSRLTRLTIALIRFNVSTMATMIEKRGGKVKLPLPEKAMVDEFSLVIRKHRDEDPVTLARLLNVAFEISLGARETRQAKLARAAVRGLEVRQQLAEAEGGSLSSEDAARLLRISKTAVLKRLEARRLLAWRE